MFDSGFGGLTVARATIDLLPSEDLVYLGDTARYPYGSRSMDEVLGFSLQIARFLVEQHDIKLLVVACNTATAAALEHLVDELAVPVIGVIDPGARAVVEASNRGRVGVIGTIGTIGSGAYVDAVWRMSPDVEVVSCACPGFVEFVERGVVSGPEIELLAGRLLAPIVAADIDALLLGCTHYPYLSRVIGETVGRDVVLVSSADETAFAVARLLDTLGLAAPRHRPDGSEACGRRTFVSSGDVQAFADLGGRLFGPELIDAQRWVP